jgi:RimJ/RimL family protein N-acetyltransferase
MVAVPASEDGLAMQITTSEIGSGTAICVAIRALAPTDREALAEAFSRLSDETRRRRFRALATQLGERDLDWLTQIDHHNHEALVAMPTDSGRVVGVARYIALPYDPGAAEVAIAVDDEWQGRGVGRQLLGALVDRARAEGVTRLLAYVDAENQRVLDWITRAGGVAEAHHGDAGVYRIALGGPARVGDGAS